MRKANGQFGKGNPGKPKGATHAKKIAAAEAIKAIVDERADRLLEIVDNLDDDKFLATWIQLVEYVKPKLSRAEVKNEGGINININRSIQNNKPKSE